MKWLPGQYLFGRCWYNQRDKEAGDQKPRIHYEVDETGWIVQVVKGNTVVYQAESGNYRNDPTIVVPVGSDKAMDSQELESLCLEEVRWAQRRFGAKTVRRGLGGNV